MAPQGKLGPRARLKVGATRTWFALRPWQRHSIVLLAGALVYICQGLVYLLVDLTPDRQRGLSAVFQVTRHHPEPWGVIWIIVGALALASTVWPPQSKTWGYTGLTAMAALWGAGYGGSALFLGAPLNNLSGLAVWWLVAFMWWAISGLVNPDDLPPTGPES